MKQAILIVGQEPEKCQWVKCKLQEHYENVEVYCATSYSKALNDLSRYPYSLIIMGLDFSTADGISFIRKIRGFSDAPLLIISAHATAAEEVNILNAGADRYINVESIRNDLDMDRLLANVQALLNGRTKEGSLSYTVLSSIGLKLSTQRWQAYANGENLHLTPKQFALLSALAENIGEVVTKEQLCRRLWNAASDINTDDALKYHIMELRKKLSGAGLPNLIKVVWGVGYLVSLEPDS